MLSCSWQRRWHPVVMRWNAFPKQSVPYHDRGREFNLYHIMIEAENSITTTQAPCLHRFAGNASSPWAMEQSAVAIHWGANGVCERRFRNAVRVSRRITTSFRLVVQQPEFVNRQSKQAERLSHPRNACGTVGFWLHRNNSIA
ncbi:Hypothetical protein, putative [Bodo saltans]|uniref:Uncharacterized protein n=1 Tax=Bodo saltans TaxID=75058 RepID=A0A0S4JKF6_BODSA|nr:Hypothetical protein, putative [Bodo saltans]|eukprot:CUG92031.1 Hypothetical protein, putative [Bodo saltans]